jgi:hypothetical protein
MAGEEEDSDDEDEDDDEAKGEQRRRGGTMFERDLEDDQAEGRRNGHFPIQTSTVPQCALNVPQVFLGCALNVP